MGEVCKTAKFEKNTRFLCTLRLALLRKIFFWSMEIQIEWWSGWKYERYTCAINNDLSQGSRSLSQRELSGEIERETEREQLSGRERPREREREKEKKEKRIYEGIGFRVRVKFRVRVRLGFGLGLGLILGLGIKV